MRGHTFGFCLARNGHTAGTLRTAAIYQVHPNRPQNARAPSSAAAQRTAIRWEIICARGAGVEIYARRRRITLDYFNRSFKWARVAGRMAINIH